MKRFLVAMLVAGFLVSSATPVWAADDDKEAKAILDKGIKALGGEAKLSKIKGYTLKNKGKITFGGNDSAFTSSATLQGIDHLKSEFEGEFGEMKIKVMSVIAGDKGWRKIGDMSMKLTKKD